MSSGRRTALHRVLDATAERGCYITVFFKCLLGIPYMNRISRFAVTMTGFVTQALKSCTLFILVTASTQPDTAARSLRQICFNNGRPTSWHELLLCRTSCCRRRLTIAFHVTIRDHLNSTTVTVPRTCVQKKYIAPLLQPCSGK